MANQNDEEILKWISGLGESETRFSSVSLPIDKAIEQFVKKLQYNLVNIKHGKYKGHMASKRLWQSIGADGKGNLGFTIKSMGKNLRITLKLPDYFESTDIGRQPTHGGGSGELEKNLTGLQGWISQKGLIPASAKPNPAAANKRLAFLIARKIHRFGFKGSGWFSKELDPFKRELMKAIEAQLGTAVELNIKTYVDNSK